MSVEALGFNSAVNISVATECNYNAILTWCMYVILSYFFWYHGPRIHMKLIGLNKKPFLISNRSKRITFTVLQKQKKRLEKLTWWLGNEDMMTF